jgi:hypothetical protein
LLSILILFVYLAILSAYWNNRVKYYEKTRAGKLPPAGTPEGKQERLTISVLLVSTVLMVLFASIGSNLGNQQVTTTVLIFFTIATIGFAVRMATRKR